MQPGVTVVLATVWLVVYADVVGTTSLYPTRLPLDQYSPLAPQQRHHGVYRRIEDQQDWKDQNHENQPFDFSIDSRRSMPTSAIGSQEQSQNNRLLRKNSMLSRSESNGNHYFSPLVEDRRNLARRKFTGDKISGRDTKGLEPSSREMSPPSELEDPFVADDTFQDQGPGSVEIYKLDLFRANVMLNQTPVPKFPSNGKSKTPKKTSQASWKSKTPEFKATSPKMFHKQSNSFDDSSTEIPPNSDPFSIGGVPELQVGCEGLEASDHNKQKRSIDSPSKDTNPEIDPWSDVTPISLDLDYDLCGEEGYEEMDELVKLKKLETTTKGAKKNRGDMEATLYSDFFNDKSDSEKLPVRGDLGKTSLRNDSSVLLTMSVDPEERTDKEVLHLDKGKRDASGEAKSMGANQRRKILWSDDPEADPVGNGRRARRGIWGFGEDEGVASSDELQTENQRRRQAYERRRKEEEERRKWEEAQRQSSIGNRTNSDVEKIREEHEKSLQQIQRQEEERQRRLQHESQRRTTPDRRQMEEEHRRRLQEDELRRTRWMEEERRRQESRPQFVHEKGEQIRKEQEEEERMREEERRRRWEEEMKRRQQELDRRSFEERRRVWMLKRKQDEEEERRRNDPSNLYDPARVSNGSRAYSSEAERQIREREERERQRKLNEYIQRTRPIRVNSGDGQAEETGRRKQGEEQKRLDEERKLQEYIRRNQPVRVSKVNDQNDRVLEYRRRMDDARQYNRPRYPGPESGRRNHGPSAPTNIDPREYVDESRRREAERRMAEERMRERQKQQEQLRREALRREEEVRRMQSRRYEEERKRLEAAKQEEERRMKEMRETQGRRSQTGRNRPLENTRHSYEDRRRFEDHRRRQDTSLIPANLLSNESRRPIEVERQRQEQERRRMEAEWRRHESSRAKETRENEERARAMKEQRRRQEEARLNALPVSARIIVRPPASRSFSPDVLSRSGFDTDIDFQGANPYRPGVEVSNFPAPKAPRPVESPSPCIWAVVQCCPSNTNRLVACFESMGCPGVNWDPNPCRVSIRKAATEEVMKFYAENEGEDNEFF